ncbi:hypothetical protein BO78DRAFT_192273 [Aspergillus sclerotiicarbonarius CBS 121057]|uniref:Uncharacterized protein n=1 Tax=Aspergillus sclerotiicarbonarius (strain CBS 121057 / IBT 28362) TaxID=1448318 RepID=A0A319E169_ASPSB|nr:hypothetical protein BO78DRAFT_192273 [Aspergillus sclerotiicarbonarius CBS 121057]
MVRTSVRASRENCRVGDKNGDRMGRVDLRRTADGKHYGNTISDVHSKLKIKRKCRKRIGSKSVARPSRCRKSLKSIGVRQGCVACLSDERGRHEPGQAIDTEYCSGIALPGPGLADCFYIYCSYCVGCVLVPLSRHMIVIVGVGTRQPWLDPTSGGRVVGGCLDGTLGSFLLSLCRTERQQTRHRVPWKSTMTWRSRSERPRSGGCRHPPLAGAGKPLIPPHLFLPGSSRPSERL